MRWLGRRSVLTVEKQFDRQSRNLRQMQIHGCQGRRGQLCADAVIARRKLQIVRHAPPDATRSLHQTYSKGIDLDQHGVDFGMSAQQCLALGAGQRLTARLIKGQDDGLHCVQRGKV